ncbi:MAG: pyrroloquinoline quinone-dependent dehydrogenase [Pseudomonadales bacterium]
MKNITILILALSVLAPGPAASAQATDTSQQAVLHYGGDAGGSQFTPLKQIDRGNVQDLSPAWTARSGDLGADFQRKGHSFQSHPLYWQGLVYYSTSSNLVVAVDAANGIERWRFDPELPRDIGYSESASRGVSFWQGQRSSCPERIFIGTLVGQLHALDAHTGKPCQEFGNGGVVDLGDGAIPAAAPDSASTPAVSPGDYSITSPPVVAGDRLIVGSAIGDNRADATERGVVTALDARTGAVLWRWDPIPRSATDPTWNEWANNAPVVTGSANAWAPLSADPALGLVYVPTGSASPDFYGGARLGDNRYANSVVALEIATGKVRWHQQLVHHDVWDYDTPAQPTLTDLERGAERIEALLITTKTGMLFAFDRATGKPLYPISERPVPGSDVPGEVLSETQPFSSVPALADQRALGPDDAFGLLYLDKQACKRILESYRSEGIFTPPTMAGTIQNPGWAGGANWGGVAVDAQRRIAVVAVNQLPGLVRLIKTSELATVRAAEDLDDWQITVMQGTPYTMARRMFLSPLGLPCIKPPWGKLVAVDLTQGSILWEQPLGTIANLAPAPVPNFNWGVPLMGGALLTRSGLLIIGAAAEHVLRVFDTRSGELLHSIDLPAAAMSVPMSYEHEGVQYIVVAAGGHSAMGLDPGDYLISLRLPDAR